MRKEQIVTNRGDERESKDDIIKKDRGRKMEISKLRGRSKIR